MDTKSLGIKLNKSQKLWLSELVKFYFKREKPDLITLRIVLNDNLEESFDYRKFDYRLVRSDGIPTLLGIWYDHPNNSILNYVDKVIINIRDTLKRMPTIKRLEAKTIAEKINTKPEIVEMCFDLIFSIGGFASSDSSSSGKPGFEVLEIDNIDVVTNYLFYKDLDSIWKRFTEKPIKKIRIDEIISSNTQYQASKETISNTERQNFNFRRKRNRCLSV